MNILLSGCLAKNEYDKHKVNRSKNQNMKP